MVLESIGAEHGWTRTNDGVQVDVQKVIFCLLLRITVVRRGSRLFPPAMAAMAVGLTIAVAGHSHAKLASSYCLLIEILEARCRHSRALLDAAKRTEVARQETVTPLFSLRFHSLATYCLLPFFSCFNNPILSCFLGCLQSPRALFFLSFSCTDPSIDWNSHGGLARWVSWVLCVMVVLRGTDVAWA